MSRVEPALALFLVFATLGSATARHFKIRQAPNCEGPPITDGPLVQPVYNSLLLRTQSAACTGSGNNTKFQAELFSKSYSWIICGEITCAPEVTPTKLLGRNSDYCNLLPLMTR